jgi:ABC-type phosphate/phosphonate transport system substrate-binding protein
VPLELRREILQVLTSLHEDPGMRQRLALGLVKRFVPVSPSSYDDIRMMLEACEAVGFIGIH